jgi:hypothetical protein
MPSHVRTFVCVAARHINRLHKLLLRPSCTNCCSDFGPSWMPASPQPLQLAPPHRFVRRPRRSEPAGEFLKTAARVAECAAGRNPVEPCESGGDSSLSMTSSRDLGKAHYNRLIGATLREELVCVQYGADSSCRNSTNFEPSWLHAFPQPLQLAPPARFLRRRCQSEPTGEFSQICASTECNAGRKLAEPCDPGCEHSCHSMTSSCGLGKAHHNRLIGAAMHEERGCVQKRFEIKLPVGFEELWHSIEPSACE